MPDSAADVIADALTHHRPTRTYRNLIPETVPDLCDCGARDLAHGDRREQHLADVVVAALTQAGFLGIHPAHPVKRDYTAEAAWRAAALNVVTETTTNHLPGTDATHIQHIILATFWPSLAVALNRLIKAKADLLKEHP